MGFKEVSECYVCGGYVESSFKKAKCIKCKNVETRRDLCEHGNYHCQICEVRMLNLVCEEQQETIERYKKALEYIATFNSSEAKAQHLQAVAKNTLG